MDNPLSSLLEEGIISEVLGRLQSGKEAEVFIVRYGERVVAAKVYKDHTQRSFKNRSAYKEGRSVRNSRDQRAMGRRSAFGKDTEEDAWKSAEVDAMYKLHAADVRIPAPVLYFEGVLLMELVLDADGETARRLIDTTLSAEQANAAYHDMLVQLVRMLTCDLIHGDLSPYNVLWGESGVTIIDFPQIVSAAQNSNSERFFLRDAENILGHFRAIDPRLEARRGDAAEIWRAYMRRELTSHFVPTGRLRPPPPQRPIPIGAPRPTSNSRPAARFHGPARSPQQPSPRDGRSPPQHRGGGPAQPPSQHRGGGPSHQQSPPQHRGGGPSHPQSPPQQRGGRPPQQPSPQQRGGRSPHQQRGAAGAPQPQRHAGRSSGPGNGPARRAMPEVIVRPRVAAGAAPRDAQPAPVADSARSAEHPRKPESRRR